MSIYFVPNGEIGSLLFLVLYSSIRALKYGSVVMWGEKELKGIANRYATECVLECIAQIGPYTTSNKLAEVYRDCYKFIAGEYPDLYEE